MFVSVITSTADRFRFIPRLIEMYRAQTYPKEQMEWLILDDGLHKVEPLFIKSDLPNVRYIQLNEKHTMGAKLNMLKDATKGDIVIVMDDDDYYPPSRVQVAVEALQQNPKKLTAGCSEVYMYYTDTNEIYRTGPYHKRHALNCTLAWRKTYAETHEYDDAERCAVESKFLNDFTSPMVQLPAKETILHIIHSSNTFNAIKARTNGTLGLLQKTELKLEDFMKDPTEFINAY